MFFKLLSIFVIFNACSAAIIVGNKTIDIKETFEKVCFNELNEYVKNIEKELSNTTTPYVKVNVSTVECLMFCGYKKVGIVDNDGNIETNSLKALLAAENSTVESAILNCAATEKTTNVCEKALKNVKCIFAEGIKVISKGA